MRKMLVLIVVSAPAWAGWVEKYRSGESSLAEGRTAVALEHLQAAAKEAEVARASDAQLAAVYDALGRAGMGSGHYRDGRRNFERALRLAADGPLEARAAVTSNLGQACQALGEPVRAEQLFRQALAAMPNRADLWNLLGGVLALQRRYKEAEDALWQALSNPADPASVTARNDLAVIYEARGKLREAADLYQQAISSAPCRAVPRQNATQPRRFAVEAREPGRRRRGIGPGTPGNGNRCGARAPGCGHSPGSLRRPSEAFLLANPSHIFWIAAAFGLGAFVFGLLQVLTLVVR